MSDKLSRRHFFKVSGGLAAGAGLATGAIPSTGSRSHGRRRRQHGAALPAQGARRCGTAEGRSRPVAFTYPDASSPCTLLKTGQQPSRAVSVPNATSSPISTLCTHMGCPGRVRHEVGLLQVPVPLQHVRRREERTDGVRASDRGPAAHRAAVRRQRRHGHRDRRRRPDLRPSIQHSLSEATPWRNTRTACRFRR